MPTTPVTIHLPNREPIPAHLSTERAESSHGIPVLVMEGGGSYPEDQPVAFGVGDVSDLGLVGALLLEAEPDPDAQTLLKRWQKDCAAFLGRHGLSMAVEWLDAGGWEDGISWTQETDNGETRHLVDELDRAPLERVVAQHVEDAGEDAVEGAAWMFPDGSGVMEIGAVWDVFDPNGRTEYGRISAYVINARTGP